MTTTTARRPRTITVLGLAVALLGALLLGPPAPLAAAAVPDELARDQSTRLPQTQHGEGTGDFLGRGYDQRARIEDGFLNIYDPPSKGGGLVRSTATDLESNAAQIDEAITDGLPVFTDPIVWTPSALFLAGYRTGDKRPIVYRVKPDGTCATADCADDAPGWNKQDIPRFGYVLAMAATTIGSTPVLAVGTSNNGIMLLRQSDGTQIGNPYVGCNALQGGAVLVLTTAMAFAPPDSATPGVLSYACFAANTNATARSVTFAENGTTSNATSWTGGVSGHIPIATAVGTRSDGSLLSAFGLTDGSVVLLNPKVSSPTPLARTTDADKDTGPIDGLTFVDRWDDEAGATQDVVAVSSISDTGRVFRFAGGASLVAQPVAPGGDTTTDVGGIRAWFPGYKTGRLAFVSLTDEPVQIDFASGSEPGFGCWFGAALPDRNAFPQSRRRLENGATSPVFTIGGLTAGTAGNCASTDSIGQWSAYLVVTPVRHPQDVTTAKLTISRGGVLTVKTATTTTPTGTLLGGSLRLKVAARPGGAYALGDWYIGIEGPPSPFSGNPTVTGTQLDPAGTERPVYRFDVSATRYTLLVRQPPRMSAVLKPLLVQARSAQGGWEDQGLLVPQGQPTRATNGTVTLAPVSFYFQNRATGPQYDYLRVTGGDLGTGVFIDLSLIPEPPTAPPLSQITVCPSNGSQSCDANADPMDNGLDQHPLKIQISDASGVLPVVAGGPYGRVYYRDDNGDLVTGLIPTDGSTYVRVSPYAGAYPNDGSSGSATRPPTNAPVGGRFGYLTTTSTNRQEITAVVDGLEMSDSIIVTAREFSPQATQGLTGVQGFHITGCSDYTPSTYCRVAKATATAPALFHTNDPDTGELRIGLMFTTLAQTAASSLPLKQTAGSEHTVAANTISVNNGEMTLDSTIGFKSTDTFDTWVISHGEAVPVKSITVGGG